MGAAVRDNRSMAKKRVSDGWILLLTVLVAGALWILLNWDENPTDLLSESDPGVLGTALLELPTADPRTPYYNRAEFGERWADTDRNGCDTRNDILARDLDNVRLRSDGCLVDSGRLVDPYTGAAIDFSRGPVSSEEVQIDHVVSLSNAWRSGAYQWDLVKREEFANDPLNLLAVDGQANMDKGSLAADEWLPPEASYHCEFVARQITVKSKWGLAVTESEREALAEVLLDCTG